MKTLPFSLRLLTGAILTGFAGPASAAVIIHSWDSGFAGGGLVPDGNPAGWSDTRVLSGITGQRITDVNVRLEIAGEWNGDLFAYLQHDTGISILLNRPGRTGTDAFGFSDGGLNAVFDDTGTGGDSHLMLTGGTIQSGGSWQPDGRAVDPSAVLDADARTRMLNGFNGFDPNGSWTLFVADMSGGAKSTVDKWGLEITVAGNPPAGVPEAGATLWLLTGALACCMAVRRRVMK